MTTFQIVATTSGALPLDTDLHTSTQRLLTVALANSDSAELRVYIGETEFNNAAKFGGTTIKLPAFKDYPNFIAFLKEWTTIEADPIQVARYL